MRKFLLIFACAFSFCVHSETNVVQLTQEQYLSIMSRLNSILGFYDDEIYESVSTEVDTTGRLYYYDEFPSYLELPSIQALNQVSIAKLLHLIISGSTDQAYNTSSNNILAYASSLREHNADVRESLDSIDYNILSSLSQLRGILLSNAQIRDSVNNFCSVYTNRYEQFRHFLYSYNFDLIYDAITNLDFNVSISNQIDLLQVMSGNISDNFDNISNVLVEISQRILDFQRDNNNILDKNHGELMDFLHSLSNGAFFASNMVNCCGCSNSNYQDSVIAMLQWMTNSWSRNENAGVSGGDSSNSVWWAWRPDDEHWSDLFIPALEWKPDLVGGGYYPIYKPRDEQFDQNFLGISQQYNALLDGFETGDIKGQEFLTGLIDLQLHILANMSTQIYMLNDRLPSKTNLWDWIESYKQEVQDAVREAEDENSQMVETVKGILDYSPFSMVGNHFPKVSNALKSLKVEEGASPVVRIPIPLALRVSDSDELVVDVRESSWWSSGRTWCRWIFTFVWGWLFIRLGLVPIFYIFFFTVRVAEISAHLVFMGSVRGSSGIVSSFGAAAVDMVLSLVGIDTDFKKFVWGIMRD